MESPHLSLLLGPASLNVPLPPSHRDDLEDGATFGHLCCRRGDWAGLIVWLVKGGDNGEITNEINRATLYCK